MKLHCGKITRDKKPTPIVRLYDNGELLVSVSGNLNYPTLAQIAKEELGERKEGVVMSMREDVTVHFYK